MIQPQEKQKEATSPLETAQQQIRFAMRMMSSGYVDIETLEDINRACAKALRALANLQPQVIAQAA
jgi:hypothetical protein